MNNHNRCGLVRIFLAVCLSALLAAPAAMAQEEIKSEEETLQMQIENMIAGMTVEEKAAQMFMVTPEALTGTGGVTAAGDLTRAAFDACPVGGIIYMGDNIQSWEQTRSMLVSMQQISMDRIGVPAFLAADEEGGSVCRISGRLEGVPGIESMRQVGETGEPLQAQQVGIMIGAYMQELGFNVDLAPVADVLTNPGNAVIGSRSFSSDPQVAAEMVSMAVQGLHEGGVCATLKHFPGHGNTAEDSHAGLAVSGKTLEELEACEFLPFETGIRAGAEFVMTGHIALPAVTGDYVPATLSETITTSLLREQLGFDGIIITDALEMAAVTNSYSSGDASVRAVLAGADVVLMPADFYGGYHAVVDAVYSGTISSERLDESLRRILKVKLKLTVPGGEEW